MRAWQRAIVWLLMPVLLLVGAGLYVLLQHDFAMKEQVVTIATTKGKLGGTLTLPESYQGRVGLVLFIHGDGPINASHDDGYKPLWERLASLGYASLSLDKRGIGHSEGSWLDQSIDDRVEEARQAIAWARSQPMIDGSRIGVWGASQAGWVIPKLAGQEDLAFSILVSPAINWISQGEFNTRREMEQAGFTEAEVQVKTAYNREVLALLERGASYGEYESLGKKTGLPKGSSLMSEERWRFVMKNVHADATADLAGFRTPVLLMLGGHDLNVDVEETDGVYRRSVKPDLLKVSYLPEADHSMMSPVVAKTSLRAVGISLFAPRSITVPDYMDEISIFLQGLKGS